jgi:hypothetical protein
VVPKLRGNKLLISTVQSSNARQNAARASLDMRLAVCEGSPLRLFFHTKPHVRKP